MKIRLILPCTGRWKESKNSSAVFNESCDAYQTEDSKDYCKKRNKIDDKPLDTVRDDLKDAGMTSIDTKDIDEEHLAYYFMDRKDNSKAVYFYLDGKIKCIGKDRKRKAYESEEADQILKACDDAVDQLNEADDAFVKEHFGNNQTEQDLKEKILFSIGSDIMIRYTFSKPPACYSSNKQAKLRCFIESVVI